LTDLAGPDGPEPVAQPDGEQPADRAPASISTFSLEGRAAPGLYSVGWLGALIGLALIAVSALATGNAAAPWLFLVGLVILAGSMVAAAGSQAIERSRRSDHAYRGPSPVLVLLAAVPLGVLAVLVVVAPLTALGLDAASPAGQALSSGLLALTYLVTIRLLVVGTGSLGWADMGLRATLPSAIREFVLGVACVVPVLVVSGLVGLALSQVLPVPPAVLPAPTSTAGLILNLVTAVLVAPLGEELFFRGFSTTAWARDLGARPAVIRGALFFAAVHALNASGPTLSTAAGYALFSFLGVLPVALALGVLFVGRRSLYAPLGLHAGYNLAIVLASMTVG
jgi:membrane protease YdiL (CAAX protease family)